MVRVKQIVTIYLIESSTHLLDQNRYPVDTSLIHLESRKSPTVEVFDVDSGGISIITMNTKEYHSEVLENITRIMRRTLTQVVLVLRRKEERSLINTSFLGEYECSSLALEREGRDEKKRLDHLKQDQEMLVIKIFSKRKKIFRERKKCEKIRAKRDCMMMVKEIVSRLVEEEEVSHFGKEGSITWQSMVWMEEDAKDGLAKQDVGKRVKDTEKEIKGFGEMGVQVMTFMRRVLMDSRDNIGRSGDILERR
ncbi:hypothetical protein Tco_1122165 [Tanacetum coccineum]|uniref:Uncharacterized protein n=1 Tax=Tanacetum coccineum TaxID=301880 RepID=A0ABQ5J1D6_9ASTR